MPLYDYRCDNCRKTIEEWSPAISLTMPTCCGEPMIRLLGGTSNIVQKSGYPRWIDRIDEIHKAQTDRGERLRMPHPKEVGAN